VPMSTPTKHQARFSPDKAVEKPRIRLSITAQNTSSNTPMGSGTLRNSTKTA
jgi:hypothetical protein